MRHQLHGERLIPHLIAKIINWHEQVGGEYIGLAFKIAPRFVPIKAKDALLRTFEASGILQAMTQIMTKLVAKSEIYAARARNLRIVEYGPTVALV